MSWGFIESEWAFGDRLFCLFYCQGRCSAPGGDTTPRQGPLVD